MQVYLYAKSGHTVGLEETKRCAAITHALKEFDPILCTSDFRAGAYAQELLEINRYVNVDVLRNLTNIMNRRDILLYETSEANNEVKEGIEVFCSFTFNLSEIDLPIVDTQIYTPTENPLLEKTIFYGDDDYENNFLFDIKKCEKLDINLLMGHYFFLGNEKEFKSHFTQVIDEEEYVQTIKNSKFLLTASQQSALESMSCGNKPVIFKRKNKTYNEELLKKLNIPLIEEKEFDKTIKLFEDITTNYPTLGQLDLFEIDEIKAKIKDKIDLFNKLN